MFYGYYAARTSSAIMDSWPRRQLLRATASRFHLRGLSVPGSANTSNRAVQEGTIGVIPTLWSNENYGGCNHHPIFVLGPEPVVDSLHPGNPRTRTRIWCTSDFATYSHDDGYERMTAMRTSTLVNGKKQRGSSGRPALVGVAVDGLLHAAQPANGLSDLINRAGLKLSQVCYHRSSGPIQTCDTCLSRPTANSSVLVRPPSPTG